MRISSRGRYGLAAMITMAQNPDINEAMTVISISEKLGISKIYLEQVFSLLKRAGLVTAIKGAQGGYRLSRAPLSILALDVLQALEQALFEGTDVSVCKNAGDIEYAMQEYVFSPIDSAVRDSLTKVTLEELATQAQKHRQNGGYMFYI
ncbi:MAG: Rrf2 family transcriptional regulator [Acetanaerobacterium sp.]